MQKQCFAFLTSMNCTDRCVAYIYLAFLRHLTAAKQLLLASGHQDESGHQKLQSFESKQGNINNYCQYKLPY